ncbi:MAG: hypothetical protein PHY56_00255 [Candidatus Omnitrophica bacterium]|nr:hypothetical protein [Candidatus Omnitrophota bacterium]
MTKAEIMDLQEKVAAAQAEGIIAFNYDYIQTDEATFKKLINPDAKIEIRNCGDTIHLDSYMEDNGRKLKVATVI